MTAGFRCDYSGIVTLLYIPLKSIYYFPSSGQNRSVIGLWEWNNTLLLGNIRILSLPPSSSTNHLEDVVMFHADIKLIRKKCNISSFIIDFIALISDSSVLVQLNFKRRACCFFIAVTELVTTTGFILAVRACESVWLSHCNNTLHYVIYL